MITIEDDDLPIEVASKLITAKKPFESDAFQTRMRAILCPGEKCPDQMDMFSDNELREIAQYLFVYCKNNEDEG